MWTPVLLGTLAGTLLGVLTAGVYVYAHAHDDDPYPHAH